MFLPLRHEDNRQPAAAYALWALGISAILCSKRICTGRRTRRRVPLNQATKRGTGHVYFKEDNQATENSLGAATHTMKVVAFCHNTHVIVYLTFHD